MQTINNNIDLNEADLKILRLHFLEILILFMPSYDIYKEYKTLDTTVLMRNRTVQIPYLVQGELIEHILCSVKENPN